MQHSTPDQVFSCPIEATLSILGGKWKTVIIWQLREGPRRYSEISGALQDAISPKMLTKQLRELETDGIVSRIAYPEIPPRVEYRLTEKGETLMPVLVSMCEWGFKNLGDRIQVCEVKKIKNRV
jgi:DNA-binding HxlR family transcriptional regulator